jgi:drug/metabolite transporter (DMT)-like permease
MRPPIDLRALAAIGTTLVLWASAFAGIRAGLAAYTPGHLALLRFLVASAALALYAALARMRLPRRRDLPGIALAGFVGVTVYHVALSYGEVEVPAGTASLLVNCSPIFTALLAMGFLGERLRGWGWGGIALSFAGVALIALGQDEALRVDLEALLILLAAFAQGCFFVLQKPYLATYRPLELSAYAIWAGTLFMLAVFFPGLIAEVRAAPLDATIAVVYLGIFPAAVANVAWAYALALAPASNTASFLYLVPALAIGIAWIWLGEIPSAISLVGGAVALAGVVLVNTRGRQPRSVVRGPLSVAESKNREPPRGYPTENRIRDA